MTQRHLPCLLACLLSATAATAAPAEAIANFTLSELSLTLIDLDPDDGIAPQAVLQGPYPIYTLTAYGPEEEDRDYEWGYLDSPSFPFATGQAQATSGDAVSSIDASADALSITSRLVNALDPEKAPVGRAVTT